MTILGGTSITVSPMDRGSFILGTEGGSLFKCSINPNTLRSINSKISQSTFETSSVAGGYKVNWTKEAIWIMNSVK